MCIEQVEQCKYLGMHFHLNIIEPSMALKLDLLTNQSPCFMVELLNRIRSGGLDIN